MTGFGPEAVLSSPAYQGILLVQKVRHVQRFLDTCGYNRCQSQLVTEAMFNKPFLHACILFITEGNNNSKQLIKNNADKD